VNSDYSLAEGPGSEDIVPSLVFDDGRFTYLRFANNREVPAVFHVQGTARSRSSTCGWRVTSLSSTG
jgi:type IV secretory pathway VirB9-like protein